MPVSGATEARPSYTPNALIRTDSMSQTASAPSAVSGDVPRVVVVPMTDSSSIASSLAVSTQNCFCTFLINICTWLVDVFCCCFSCKLGNNYVEPTPFSGSSDVPASDQSAVPPAAELPVEQQMIPGTAPIRDAVQAKINALSWQPVRWRGAVTAMQGDEFSRQIVNVELHVEELLGIARTFTDTIERTIACDEIVKWISTLMSEWINPVTNPGFAGASVYFDGLFETFVRKSSELFTKEEWLQVAIAWNFYNNNPKYPIALMSITRYLPARLRQILHENPSWIDVIRKYGHLDNKVDTFGRCAPFDNWATRHKAFLA